MTVWAKYGKAVVSVLIAVIWAIQAALSDHWVSPVEAVQILIAFATAASVYLVPVVPSYPWVKTAIGILLAVLNMLVTVVGAGWSTTNLTVVILAVLTGLGVTVAPAVSETRPPTPAEP